MENVYLKIFFEINLFFYAWWVSVFFRKYFLFMVRESKIFFGKIIFNIKINRSN